MKYFFCFSLLLLSSSTFLLFSQGNLDSLQTKLAITKMDSTRLLIYEQMLKQHLVTGQLEEVLNLSEDVLKEFEPKDDKAAMQMAYLFKAIVLNYQGQNEAAIRLCMEGAALSIEIGDSLQAAKHYTNIGAFYQKQGKKDKALEFYLKSYPIYNHYKDYKRLSSVLNNIAILYREQEKYKEAIKVYEESLSIRKNLKDDIGIANTHMNMGALYSYIDRMEDAISNLEKATEIFERHGVQADIASCNNVMGNIYYNLGCHQEALEYLHDAHQYFEQHPNIWYQANNAFVLGSIHLTDGDYRNAEQLLEEAIIYSKAADRWGDKQAVFFKLSKAKHALGKDIEAYDALFTAFEHLDSVKEERRMELEQESLAHFEVLQKEKALVLNQLELERRTRQRDILIVSLLLLLSVAFGLFLFLRQRIMIANQKTALQQQHIKQLQQEKKLAALNAIVEGEEKERMRMAADLHDGLGGLLTSVKTHYTQLFKNPDRENLHVKTSQLIDEACSEVRRISYNMAPRALAIAGLKGAIEDLCLNIKEQGLHCEWEIIGIDENKLENYAVSIYRIVQELTNNCLKHANANHLFVQLYEKNELLSILIEDDGRGFDIKSGHYKKGLGLSSIESRVKIMNGQLNWDAVPGEGTSVSIRIPLEAHFN